MFRSAIVASLVTVTSLVAAESAPPSAAEVDALIAKASAYILAQARPNGAFLPGDKYVLGITGLATEALASAPGAVPASDPKIAKAIAYVNGFRQNDGGVYDPTNPLGNYCTSIALNLWITTKSDDTAAITAAQNYLFGLQNHDEKNPCRGGMGYGSKGAGFEDLSNTSFAVQALRNSGVPASDPRMQEALRFLERCQDLSSVNKLPWARDSGGAVYSPDESKAGGSWDRDPPKEGAAKPKLAPYGSMTYALISSYVVLDLKPDDPRVVAALGWAKANYQFNANPGMAAGKEKQGLFYYYRAMAKTFDLVKAKELELKDGTKVDWRGDLFAAIKSQAKIEGDKAFWNNDADRWAEGVPVLVTSYVLKSLKSIRASL